MKHLPKLLLWLPAALWYRVIWGFSAQTAAVPGGLSDRLLWRLLAALSPMLRETCFLAICGLLGALSVLGAFLSIRRPLRALTASLGLSLALSGLPPLLWGLPTLTATLLSALDWAVGVGLWLLCLAAKRLAPYIS